MASEIKKEIALEIAHVLFIDIVGYSKLLINEQHEALEELNQIVRGTEAFRAAEAAEKLIRLPTGDGMALVFSNTLEAPVQCALEISRALQSRPHLQVRMGVNSGPVSGVMDVNDRGNVAGAGINLAQRVMDCGEGGHILLSKRVAEDLALYRQWRPHLHDLGEWEVKHEVRISVVNLYKDELGNARVPEKFAKIRAGSGQTSASGRFPGWKLILGLSLLVGLVAGGLLIFQRPDSHETKKEGSTTIPAAVPQKSVAVLPFENLSSDRENAYFAGGVQDEILTNLARIADLKVISRTSVMQYKTSGPRNLREIGQQLGVAHLLEGSVQRAGNKVRVIAQLIDARTDAHLWAQTYDRDLSDVFAIQSEIARTIADQLRAKLSPTEENAIRRPPTTNVPAFDLYSRARALLLYSSFGGSSNLQQAADLLEQAVAYDPTFFEAYCQLASTQGQLYLNVEHTPERLALARQAMEAAFRLRPDDGEAHLARAEFLYNCHLDYAGALAELEIAGKTLPNNPAVFELTGYVLRRQGKREKGLQSLERALELDPRNFFTLQQVALSYLNLRRYAEAAAILDRALTILPNDPDTRLTRAALEADWKADNRPSHEALESILAGNPKIIETVAGEWFLRAIAERAPATARRALASLGEEGIVNDGVHLSRAFGEGLVARMEKDETKAHVAFTRARQEQEKIVQAQPNYGPVLSILGLIDAGLGRKQDALREGRQAMELLPVEKDSINGAHMIEYFAIIAAWVGEKDLACEQLGRAARLPVYGPTTYGMLKLSPYWDPLRGEPCFEKIVASLAPKN